jgi:hypothetical protein
MALCVWSSLGVYKSEECVFRRKWRGRDEATFQKADGYVKNRNNIISLFSPSAAALGLWSN